MAAPRWDIKQLQAYQTKIEQQKESKYRNQKVELAGRQFDSKKEAARFSELQMLQKAGEISDLEFQVSFEIIPAVKIGNKKVRARFYIADFRYKTKDGKTVVEDVKGYMTREYRMKRQLMAVVYGIEIKET